MTLNGDEIWSIIQDVGLEYKDYQTPEKMACSAAGIRKFHGACVSYGHRGDMTLGIELETCITNIVVTAQPGGDTVVGSRKFCLHDVWPSRCGAGNRKIRRVKGPRYSTVQRVRWGHAYSYYEEFMEWLTDLLMKKVTVSTVNRKLKELRHAGHPCIPPRLADLRFAMYVMHVLWALCCLVHRFYCWQ